MWPQREALQQAVEMSRERCQGGRTGELSGERLTNGPGVCQQATERPDGQGVSPEKPFESTSRLEPPRFLR